MAGAEIEQQALIVRPQRRSSSRAMTITTPLASARIAALKVSSSTDVTGCAARTPASASSSRCEPGIGARIAGSRARRSHDSCRRGRRSPCGRATRLAVRRGGAGAPPASSGSWRTQASRIASCSCRRAASVPRIGSEQRAVALAVLPGRPDQPDEPLGARRLVEAEVEGGVLAPRLHGVAAAVRLRPLARDARYDVAPSASVKRSAARRTASVSSASRTS